MESLFLAASAFLSVSSGPFGIEKALYYLPVTHAIYMLFVVTVLFMIPTAVMSVEMIRQKKDPGRSEGGAMRWVSNAFGRRMGIIHGAMLLPAMVVDSAIYPKILQDNVGIHHVGVLMVAVIACILISWNGFRYTGLYATVQTIVILSPFIALFFITPWDDMYTTNHNISPNWIIFASKSRECLRIIVWNVTGLNLVASFTHEVGRIKEIIVQTMIFVTFFVVAMYVMALCVGSHYIHSQDEWNDGSWGDVGSKAMRSVGSVWMFWASIGASVGAMTLKIYSISYMWQGMVNLGAAPACFLRFRTNLILSSMCTLFLSYWIDFEKLVDMSVVLNSGAIIVQSIAWCEIMGSGVLAWRTVMSLSVILVTVACIVCNTVWCAYTTFFMIFFGVFWCMVVDVWNCIKTQCYRK